MAIKRGEIYFVDLGPVVGREMNGGKRRPVVVLSLNDINRKPLVVTVIPGTTTASSFRNVAHVAPSKRNGLNKDTYFLCHQVRALDHSRFRAPPVEILSSGDMDKIDTALKFTMGLS